jgi:hypothetical protein
MRFFQCVAPFLALAGAATASPTTKPGPEKPLVESVSFPQLPQAPHRLIGAPEQTPQGDAPI